MNPSRRPTVPAHGPLRIVAPAPFFRPSGGDAVWADERTLLREALAGLRPDDSPLRAQLLVRLAMAEAIAAGPGTEPERLCGEAAAMARRLADDALLASTLDAIRHVPRAPGDVDRRIATAHEILRHAQAAEVRELEVQARQWLVRDHLERGDRAAADEEMRRHAALAQALRVPRHLWHAAHWRAVQAYLGGRLDDVERLLRAAREVGRRVDPARACVHFAAGLFMVRRDQGRVRELVRDARRLAAHGELPWEFRAGIVLLYVEAGLRADARQALGALLRDGVEWAPRDAGGVAALCALAEASVGLDAIGTAATLYEALQPHAGRNLVLGDAPILQGAVARHLGRLAGLLGRGTEAEAHLQRALGMHRRLHALPLQARTHLDLGAVLVGRGNAGDWSRASVHLREAHLLAGSLGMGLVARQAMALLARVRRESRDRLPGARIPRFGPWKGGLP